MGERGVAFATEKENALIILTQKVENPTSLKQLITENKVIIASDGNAIKG